MPMASAAPRRRACLGMRLSPHELQPASPHRARPSGRRWKATSVTLSMPSARASLPALAGAVPRRDHRFGLPALRTGARSARDTVPNRLRLLQLADCWHSVRPTRSEGGFVRAELTDHS